MNRDVNGLYAILGLDPCASQEAIGAAFRRKAKELHPDVAGTGNAHAFISLRRAYDTLSDPIARTAYARVSQQASKQPAQHGHATAGPPNANRNAKAWFLAFAIILVLSVSSATWLERSRANADLRANRLPNVQASPPSKQVDDLSAQTKRTQPDIGGLSIVSAASPKLQMYYALAAGSPISVWHKTPQGGYLQNGFIEPFTNVELLRSFPADHLAEVRFADGSSGYMDPRSIGPGDAMAAKEAYCLYKPGRPLNNQKILSRTGSGPYKITIENQGSQPAIVVMRSALGRSAITLLINAYNVAYVDQFSSGLYRPEFRFGDNWSQKCGDIFGHRHTQRFPSFDNFVVRQIDESNGGYEYTVMHYTIIPVVNGNTKAVEISDDEFNLE